MAYEDVDWPGDGAGRRARPAPRGRSRSADGGKRERERVTATAGGFEADSASFVSAQAGYVLGARDCSLLPCKALLETTANGGATWAR